MFLWHTGSQERARSCVEHALDTAPGDAACTSLLGWILVHSTSGDLVEPEAEDVGHASSLFEETLQKRPKHVEVWLSCFKLCSVSSPTGCIMTFYNVSVFSFYVNQVSCLVYHTIGKCFVSFFFPNTHQCLHAQLFLTSVSAWVSAAIIRTAELRNCMGTVRRYPSSCPHSTTQHI